MTVVALEDVSVRLSRRGVLKGLTWSPPGRGRTLLLGRNGAGKTTTLRVASGALRPGGGRVLLDGQVVSSPRLRRMVALMPQAISSVPGLSVIDQVAFAGWLGGLSERDARKSAAQALAQVDLVELRDRSASRLSGGELRRVGLAEVLVRPSGVLLLDEPTAGLDPAQRARFRGLLLQIERPIIVSTHQLDDVDTTFDHVAVIDAGTVIFTGTMEAFLDVGEGSQEARRAEGAFLRLVGAA